MEALKVAHTVRVCHIIPHGIRVPEILLVLEKPEFRLPQGFKERHAELVWKMPGGGYEQTKDFDLIAAARREYKEEVSHEIPPLALSKDFSYCCTSESKIPRFDRHITDTFLWLTRECPKVRSGDSCIMATCWFPLSRLPSEKRLEGGAPLAAGHWRHLYGLFSNAACKQALLAAGITDVRQEEIIESWQRHGNLTLPA